MAEQLTFQQLRRECGTVDRYERATATAKAVQALRSDFFAGTGFALQQDGDRPAGNAANQGKRSEEHTSELQSRGHLVCRLLLEKKKRMCYRLTRTLQRIDIYLSIYTWVVY